MESAIFQCGKQSVKIPVPVYIRASASVAGTKEGEGPLGSLFDVVGQDDLFGCETWEEAESTLQKEAVTLAMGKAKKYVICLPEICLVRQLQHPLD